jgi:large subunit ribosomal protein L9
MKVLLTQDIDNLGFAGEVKEVANGYGRNYLIPRGLAVLATPGALKQTDIHRRRATERRERIAAELTALSETIRQTTLTFQAKAGEKGRLYGSITTADIADRLAESIGQEVDRRKIALETPIKQLGAHTVTVRLSPDHAPGLTVVVESTEPVREEAPAGAEEPAVEEEPIAAEESAEEE